MNVSISVSDPTVVVTATVPKSDGSGTVDLAAAVEPGQLLGGIPYRELRGLDDGDYELDVDPMRFMVTDDPAYGASEYADSKWLSWIGYAVLCFLLAGGAYLIFFCFELGGGSMRINWLVAYLYEWGGKDLVAGVFAGGGCLCLLMACLDVLVSRRAF